MSIKSIGKTMAALPEQAQVLGTWLKTSAPRAALLAVPALLAVIVSIGMQQEPPAPAPVVSDVPDFGKIMAGEPRKAAFFDYLLPRVEQSNREILETRELLLSLRDSKGALSSKNISKVNEIAARYEVDSFDISSDADWDLLLRRVDIIPPSLALAQAANESAWGTSRFALEGKNFFGEWCFKPGCGIVPSQRPSGATYEVADFNSVQESVDRYIHNLNQHPAYRELRIIREQLRRENDALSGMKLAKGLSKYSERGQRYVEMIQSIISYNDLLELDPQV